ncbi:MAG: hypothetical protein AAGI23_07595 [Bacteroidota bacterium]
MRKDLLEKYHSFYLTRLATLKTKNASLAQRMTDYKYQLFLSQPEVVDLYVCGLKPYAISGQTYDFPSESYPPNYHAYLDEDWSTRYIPRALQLIQLIQTHLLQTTPDTRRALVSSWFFQRAEDAKQLKAFGYQLADGIPFHRQILAELDVPYILCIGNGKTYSSFAGMCALYDIKAEDIRQTAYLDKSSLKWARSNERFILGVPHLSRYPVSDEMVRWLETIALMK